MFNVLIEWYIPAWNFFWLCENSCYFRTMDRPSIYHWNYFGALHVQIGMPWMASRFRNFHLRITIAKNIKKENKLNYRCIFTPCLTNFLWWTLIYKQKKWFCLNARVWTINSLVECTASRHLRRVFKPSVLTVALIYRVVLRLSVCIVAKRCVLEQKLLLTAYSKSHMWNQLVPKWLTLTFVWMWFKVMSAIASHIRHWISRKPLKIEGWFQRQPIRNCLRRIKWSRDRWPHVILKGQTRDPKHGHFRLSCQRFWIKLFECGHTGFREVKWLVWSPWIHFEAVNSLVNVYKICYL